MMNLARNVFILLFCISCTTNTEISEIDNPTGENSSLSRLYTDNTGVVFMSWVEETDNSSTLLYSNFMNGEWTEPYTVSSSENWFVNWADFPSVIGRNGELLAAHWLNKIPGNKYSYNVEVVGFQKNMFSQPLVPHTDNTATEHGFVSIVPITDSTFYSIWLDGRNTTGGHGEHGNLGSAMTLRGALLSSSGKLISESEIDDAVCDCCNTALAKTSDGLIAAYRNRTSEEIRDIHISKYENGVWGNSRPVHDDNWQIAACPVNGPSIDVNDRTVAVAWFSMLNEKGVVKVALSEDEGDTFVDPIIIDSENPLGRVDLLINKDRSIWVSWMARTELGAEFNVQKISENGKPLETHTISDINPSRGSGFPQLTNTAKGILVSWTELTDNSKKIRTAILQ